METGSRTALDIVGNKLNSLKEQRAYEKKRQNYVRLIQLEAQIFILGNLSLDLARLKNEDN